MPSVRIKIFSEVEEKLCFGLWKVLTSGAFNKRFGHRASSVFVTNTHKILYGEEANYEPSYPLFSYFFCHRLRVSFQYPILRYL
jgi:hypothetical protein